MQPPGRRILKLMAVMVLKGWSKMIWGVRVVICRARVRVLTSFGYSFFSPEHRADRVA